jgi:hypothetical protein
MLINLLSKPGCGITPYFALSYSTWVCRAIQQFSKIIRNCFRSMFSGLGTMTGTTRHVFPLILHPISSKSDGYRPTFEGLLVFRILLKTNTLPAKRTVFCIAIYYFVICQPLSQALDTMPSGLKCKSASCALGGISRSLMLGRNGFAIDPLGHQQHHRPYSFTTLTSGNVFLT